MLRVRSVSVKPATIFRGKMRARMAKSIRRRYDFNQAMRILVQTLVNRRHMGRKHRIISFPAKTLQAEKGMPANGYRIHFKPGLKRILHDRTLPSSRERIFRLNSSNSFPFRGFSRPASISRTATVSVLERRVP